MASALATIGDGARSLLQVQSDAQGFVNQFTATWGYQEPLPLTDAELHVDMVIAANELETEVAARNAMWYRVPIDIGIRKRFTEEDSTKDAEGKWRIAQERINEYMELTEQIIEFFFRSQIASNGAQSLGPAQPTTVAPENYLTELRQFYSKVRVRFQYLKTIA